MRRDYVQILLIVMLACLTAIPAASAYTASLQSPASADTALHSGDTISIQISGLTSGNQLTYRITSSDLVTPGNTASLSSVNMPVTFTTGSAQTTLTTTGLASPGATLTVTRLSDGAQWTDSGATISSKRNINKGQYDVSISGTKTGSTVGIDYSVSGTAGSDGSDPLTLSFMLTNVDSGHLTVAITEDGTSRFSQTFTITPITAPTPVPADQGSSDPGGAGGAPAAGPAVGPAAAPAQLAPLQGITGTTANIQVNEQGQALADYTIQTDPAAGFTSEVSIGHGTTITSPTGQTVSAITVTPLDPATVAATAQSGVYSFSGLSLECGPTGTQFSGGTATVSFSLTASQWADALAAVNGNTAAMTIQTFDPATNSWVSLTTVVDPATRTVSAQVSHFSMYGLFYTTVPTTPAVKTFGELAAEENARMTPSVTTVATTAVPTQLAPVVTQAPQKSPGFFDGLVNWVNSLFGNK